MRITSFTYLFVSILVVWAYAVGCTKTKQNPKIVRVLLDTEVRSFDSRYGTDANSQYIADLTGCALVSFDADGATVGELAKSWKWQKPNELSVALKNNVVFSDGTPLTAKDVVATYAFFGLKKKDIKPSPRAGAFKSIQSVEAKSNSEVVFKLEKPDASFVTNLVISIYPESKAFEDAYSAKNLPATCGAFQVAKASSNRISIKRNEKYTLETVSYTHLTLPTKA